MTATPDRTAAAATEPASTDKRPARILGLDGPRGIACLMVLAVHVGGHNSPQTVATFKLGLLGQGLVFFFALSGFLIFLPMVRRLFAGKPMPDTKSYAVHRILRVFPAYIVIFLLCSVVLRAVFVENAAVAERHFTDAGLGMLTDPLALLANLTLVHSYIPQYLQTGINPSWSLSLEFAFYIALPLLAAISFYLRGRTNIPAPVLALIPVGAMFVIGLTGKLYTQSRVEASGITDPLLLDWGPNEIAVLSRSFWSLADNFTYGMLVAVVFVAIERGVMKGRFVTRMRWWAFVGMIPAAALSLKLIDDNSRWQSTFVAIGSALLILFIIVPLARGQRSKFAELADWAPLSYIGTISLSVYLWHFPILIMVGRFGWMAGDSPAGMLWNFAVVTVVSIVFGTVTYRLVEKPALTLARRYKST
ncbi:acyltransferase [Rhodococcus sp. BP-252]|uniref:Acetyltransferase n=1 Tax=Rhodococcoides kyotonense TaxID=398843 RepID=A0A177YKF7_9NOCA|nr:MULTISPECIES: acyltransferase [Rhodococcus]MBY6413783.1 acyltransferase [Rhodococcus sp. BP-320]MBY6418436.1 acyltransferase [Rhodococcus sp. BP-321]MBY6422561.1 acyltransferase [Rhodococcus sp. BP-324]MBY6428422.1 acyltransferase [Rhodococcus sp. BP-323]MBY6433599.1 acyltransferase [Rhodococcus sp. BP-322]